MNLLKTSFLTVISTGMKILSGLVINKAISIFIGPSGLALIGQVQNAIQMMMVGALGGINSGVTKYTAEYGEQPDKLPALWSSAAKIVLFCSLIVGSLSIVFSNSISIHILKSQEYGYIFVLIGFTLVLFALNQLILAILNGIKEIKLFITINIIQSIYGLIFTTLLIFFFHLDGALIALSTNQSIVFLVLLFKLKKTKLTLEDFKQKFSISEGRKLSSYSMMTITTACTVPLSLMYIRDYIGDNLSLESAGYWQAMWYISSTYLMVITTALSTYYLPKLSELKEKKKIREELITGYKTVVPIVLFLSFSMYCMKGFIVNILFTEDFYPMLILFKWQLIGDVIKIISWLVSYLMIAKKMTRKFISTEILFSLIFVTLTVYFVDIYGLVGVTYAYATNYLLYLVVVFFMTKKVYI